MTLYPNSHVSKSNKKGVIMAADFEAAFETVSWSYLRTVLKEMNFGNTFIELINIMYLNRQNYSRILLNGFLGEKIFMHKGIRQGDPASGYLFDIAVEILAKQIANSEKLRGIGINANTEVRISQYADDTILFLDGSRRSLCGAAEELDEFSKQSGLKLNWEKTSCLPLGSLRPFDITTHPLVSNIKWVSEIKILGIYFKADISNITEINLARKLPALENEIAKWKRRHITPLGKITVIKSLLLSKLVHLLTALPNPTQKYIKTIEGMLYSFLWKNRPDRIKRAKIIQKYEFDGLQMIDLTSFIHGLKLSWVKRLAHSTAVWKTLAEVEQIDCTRLLTYGTIQLEKLLRTEIKNTFWSEVVKALKHFNELIELEPENILTEPLWFSNYTKFRTSIVTQWDKRGLRFIGDLFSVSDGNILTREEIKEKYRISMTFLCYESLIRSLPRNVSCLTQVSYKRPNIPFRMQLFFSKPDIVKYCYLLFVNALRKKCKATDAKLKQKWNRDIGLHREGSLVHVKKATNSVYLQYLHYRITSRIIATNKFLQAIRVSDDGNCTFCSREIETITHLFWQCPVTQLFIQNISRILNAKYQTHFQHTEQSWFFPQEEDYLQVVIITLTKAVIYKARIAGQKPDTSHMMNLLKLEAKQEHLASRLKNKLDFFENKWKALKHILTQ